MCLSNGGTRGQGGPQAVRQNRSEAEAPWTAVSTAGDCSASAGAVGIRLGVSPCERSRQAGLPALQSLPLMLAVSRVNVSRLVSDVPLDTPHRGEND